MKMVGENDKSITFGPNANVQDSFNTERNFIKIVFGKSSRSLKRIFCKKKFYTKIRKALQIQVEKKVDFFKHSKKYIPDVFLELNESKESLRYLSDPVLFFEKLVSDINNVDLGFFNKSFQKCGFPEVSLTIPSKILKNIAIDNVTKKASEVNKFLLQVKEGLPSEKDFLDKEQIVGGEAGKVLIKDRHTATRVGWIIKDFEKQLDLILQKRFVLFTEKAGQGKTNLVCDFVDNFIKKKGLIGVFLTGNEFNNLSTHSIESVIIKEVFGFDYDISFSEFLDDIKVLCKERDCPFTIVIDGLNENLDLAKFNNELYSFVDRALNYNYIRLVFTCRSEYFESRFSNFCTPAFQSKMILNNNYMRDYREHDSLPSHLEERLINSYFDFFSVKNTVFSAVKKQLVNDFLLLRIFCEVYGDKANQNAPKELVYDIFKDDLFKRYYDYKSKQLKIDRKFLSHDVQNVFKLVFEYMIEHNQFLNIPLPALDSLDRQLVENIINEDIFFRKDLVSDESSVFGNVEVLNFTFDEFRDYLLVDYIVNSTHDIHAFLLNLREIDEEQYFQPASVGRGLVRRKINTALEGVEKYLFLKSRRAPYRIKLEFIENLEIYDDLFIENIFSVNDQFITDDDIRKVKELFFDSTENAGVVIHYLMYRHRTNHYKKLNIFTLLDIISGLDVDSYNEYINSYFRARKKNYYYNELEGVILDLTRRLTELISCRDFDEEPELHNVMELLVLLLGVDGREYGGVSYQTIELFKKYIQQYSNVAKSRLIKYRNIKNPRVQLQIWTLLKYYVEDSKTIEKSFIEICFYDYENTWNERVKESIFNVLKCCHDLNPDLFGESERECFEIIKKEQEIDFRKVLAELDREGIWIERS